MTRLKTIIVDDEWLIRCELKLLLERHSRISVVGEAEEIAEAIQLIHDLKPDVVFMDTLMYDDLHFQISPKNEKFFKIIFLSVFDEKIINNNNINVVDCLSKPIDETKLSNIIAKL